MAQIIEKNQVGKRELLFDFISLDDFKEKPLLAMIPKEQRLTNMLMTWQADKYDSPDTSGVADGVPVQNIEDAAKDRATIQAYAQKFRRTAGVGSIAEEISNVAGAGSGEMARAIDKKLEEIGRDIEAAMCSDNETQLEASSAVPYKLRGLGKWFLATAGAVLPIDSNYRTPTAAIDSTAAGSVTEDILKTVLQEVYITYGKSQDLTLLCGPTLKKNITSFTQTTTGSTTTTTNIRSFNANLGDREIISNVMTYEGDFNKVKLYPSLLLANGGTSTVTRGRGYVLALDRLALHWGWQPRVKALPEDGSGPRAFIEAVVGLCHKNPLIGGKFAPTA